MRSGNAVFLFSGAALALSPVAAQTTSTDGGAEISQAEAIAIDAKFYAEAYGVSFEEAVRRIAIMTAPLTAADLAAQEEGSAYAGGYFENGRDFAFVVKTKANKEERRAIKVAARAERGALSSGERQAEREQRKALRQQLKVTDQQVETAETVLAQEQALDLVVDGGASLSYAELIALYESRVADLRRIDGFDGAFIDDRANAIVVMLTADPSAETTGRLAQLLGTEYRVEVVAGGMTDVGVRGGMKLLGSSTQTSPSCTTAFSVKRNSDSKMGVLTAGHCSSSSYIVKDGSTNITLNEVPNTYFYDNYTIDMKMLTYTGTATVTFEPKFHYDATSNTRTVSSVATAANINAAGIAKIGDVATRSGSFLCHLGQEYAGSGYYVQSCGEVMSKNYDQRSGTAADPKLTGGYLILMRNSTSGAGSAEGTRTTGTLKCYGGDSGGPVFANTVAYGIVKSCGWYDPNDRFSTDTRYRARWLAFSSLDQVQSRGFTVAK